MQVTIFGWEFVFRKRRLRKYHVVYPSTTTGTSGAAVHYITINGEHRVWRGS